MLLRSRAQCWAKVIRVAVTEYVRVLDVDVRRRHYHETRRGQVVAFVVQLEVEVADTWVAVVRYDTAHGVPHVHRLETMTRVSRQTLDVPGGVRPKDALMEEYVRLNNELGAEFDRYVREHPAFAARIPRGAEIILQVQGNRGFNAWARGVAKHNHEQGRPVVVVTIRRVKPIRSRLVSPRLRIEAA